MKFSPLAGLLLFSRAGFSSAAIVSNTAEAPATNLQRCLEPGEFDAAVDYFPDKYVPHSTTDHFAITYHKSYKIVTNLYNEKSYLLYQCGTEPPAEELNGQHHIVLPIPHTAGLAVTQTPQIPPLELLGRRRDIRAYIGNPVYISSPCLNDMINVEKSCSVIYDESDSSMTEIMTVAWLGDNPDAIILGGPMGTNKHDERVMSVAASQERTNVATFDWIGMYATLFNIERVATDIADKTEARYDCSAANAASMSADLPDSDKPTILWANHIGGFGDFPGGWSVAECPTSDAAYYCENAKHCGANILSRPEGVGYSRTWGGSTKYWYLSDEELLELGKDAEYWIYPDTDWDVLKEGKKEFLEQFKAVRDKQVFDTQGQGPNAWYEQRLAEYDVVALDVCSIVGNANPVQDPPHMLKWFRNIDEDPVGFQGWCEAGAVDEPYKPNAAECVTLGGDTGEPSSKSSASRISISRVSVAAVAAIVLAA